MSSDIPIYEIGHTRRHGLWPGIIYDIEVLLRSGKKVKISEGRIEKAGCSDKKYYLRVIKGHLDDGRSVPLENGSFLTFSEGTKFIHRQSVIGT